MKKAVILDSIAKCAKDFEKKFCLTRRTTKACCRTVRRTTKTDGIYSERYCIFCNRSKYKYSLYAAVVLLFTVFLCGCHSMYSIDIETDGSYMTDKTIDILIPISENDENYIDSVIEYYEAFSKYKQYQESYIEENAEKELKKTEIYRYNENGYRSMLCHFRTEGFSKGSLEDNKIKMSIYLNSKDKYMQLCERYKTFRIAVVGKNGEILNISEEYPFKSSEEYFLDNDIDYDPVNNVLSPIYIRHGKWRFWLFIVEAVMLLMPVWAIELLPAVIIFKKVKILGFPYSIIGSAAMTLPLTVYLAVRYDDAVKSTLTHDAALAQFFNLKDVSVWSVIYVFIPYISFLIITVITCVRKSMKSNEIDSDSVKL
ncbi:MAG: hypothetical protein J6B75_09150 [Ruminococcus sp.]|nr:hypothetical protein [Ruminococcus sp.]